MSKTKSKITLAEAQKLYDFIVSSYQEVADSFGGCISYYSDNGERLFEETATYIEDTFDFEGKIVQFKFD